jgi:hypothetical protein
MMTNPRQILSAVAVLLAVVGMIWPNHIVLAAAVLLLGVANFIA